MRNRPVAATLQEEEETMSGHTSTAEERPVQPEIPRSRFALGMAHYPADMEELRPGRFSDGQQEQPRLGRDVLAMSGLLPHSRVMHR